MGGHPCCTSSSQLVPVMSLRNPAKSCSFNNAFPTIITHTHPSESRTRTLCNRSSSRRRRRMVGDTELISSPSNPFVKHCVKLRLSAPYRHSTRSALLIGTTPLRLSLLIDTVNNYSFSVMNIIHHLFAYHLLVVLPVFHIVDLYPVNKTTNGFSKMWKQEKVHMLAIDLKCVAYMLACDKFLCVICMAWRERVCPPNGSCLHLKGPTLGHHQPISQDSDRELSTFQETKDAGAIIDCLLILDGVEIPKELDDPFIRVVRVSPLVMKKLAGLQSMDSIEAIGVMRIPYSFCDMENLDRETDVWSWSTVPHRILVLDGIQVYFLNIPIKYCSQHGVFLLPGCCDPFNYKAVRASRGSCFRLPIVSGRWVHLDAFRRKFGMKMVAGHPGNSDREMSSFLSRELSSSLAETPIGLVLGSEGAGLSKQSKEECELISIPMSGNFESLNVSVAGGIFLFLLQPQS
ncbi:uncharacterized protein LOC105421292 [Amborella trichopoda]|uniref:uncharacterized protein LOC105421292 n=1 Tax=Amborella trichopoda TaxID=13333 RepID=UPI0009BCD298|nr:uncharacterized protein LOC105421292 [Amborella trichopoda]|eukprot:XP_020528183.1 uncharacterized protein LOC105421292 [Amborella trichopoda]